MNVYAFGYDGCFIKTLVFIIALVFMSIITSVFMFIITSVFMSI